MDHFLGTKSTGAIHLCECRESFQDGVVGSWQVELARSQHIGGWDGLENPGHTARNVVSSIALFSSLCQITKKTAQREEVPYIQTNGLQKPFCTSE